MEKLTHTNSKSYLQLLSSFVLICIVSFSNNVYAAPDTTVFRVHVIQDSVYAGDTIDVEFYIKSNGSTGLLSLVRQFEMEIAADTSLIQQDRTGFAFDYTSLASFFGTTISNITAIVSLDPILGTLNLKTSSAKPGKGDARVGQGQYIVQDNVAGRQSMDYNYTKASSKNLLGFSNPVRIMTDSVLILGKRPDAETPYTKTSAASKTAKSDRNEGIRIYPNPVTGYVQVDQKNINQYKLIGADGIVILAEDKLSVDSLYINTSDFKAGMYILMLQIGENWYSYKIIKY